MTDDIPPEELEARLAALLECIDTLMTQGLCMAEYRKAREIADLSIPFRAGNRPEGEGNP